METLSFNDVDPSKTKQTENVFFADVGRVKDTPVYLLGDVSPNTMPFFEPVSPSCPNH